jgi:hypothetical protein
LCQVSTLPAWLEMSPRAIQSKLRSGQPISHGLLMNLILTMTMTMKTATAILIIMRKVITQKPSNVPFQQQPCHCHCQHLMVPRSHPLASIRKHQNLHNVAMIQKHIFLCSRMKSLCYVKRTLSLLPTLSWPLIMCVGSNIA